MAMEYNGWVTQTQQRKNRWQSKWRNEERGNMSIDTTTAGPPSFSKRTLLLTKALNVLFAMILYSPLHGMLSKRFMLLAFRGSKSGKSYMLVVGYMREGDEIEVISPRSWWKNLRGENRAVRMLLEGKWRDGIAEVFHGDETVVEATLRFMQISPSLVRMYRIKLDDDGRPKRESVWQATRNNALVRIRLRTG
jgi:hypothetical protein